MKTLALALAAGLVLSGPAAAVTTHYMYFALSPSEESPSDPIPPGVYVYNIDAQHAFVEKLSFPTGTNGIPTVLTIRGIAVDPVSSTFYMSYYGSTTVQTAGYLVALDLKTMAKKWQMNFGHSGDPALQNSGVDRFCLTPDGSTIFLPTGEGVTNVALAWWYQIATSTHTVTRQIPWTGTGGTGIPGAHNTICGDSGLVYMASTNSIGAVDSLNHGLSLKVYNPANNTATFLGPWAGGSSRIRPFTVNHVETEVYVNEEDYVGFGHGTVAGNVRLDVPPGNGYSEPSVTNFVCCHGVAASYDDQFIWSADANQQGAGHHSIHMWRENSSSSFSYIGELVTAVTPSYQTFKAPGWIMGTIDNTNAAGRQYIYAETGEIIDTTHNTAATWNSSAIVGRLKDPVSGNFLSTRFGLEVDFACTPACGSNTCNALQSGTATAAGDQFVRGQ